MSALWRHFAAAFRRDNYSRMSGRSTLEEYWCCMLFAAVFGCVPFGIMATGAVAYPAFPTAGAVLLTAGVAAMLFYVFYTALPMLAVYVRRLHDADRGWSGNWIGLLYGIVAVMAMLEIGTLLHFQWEYRLDIIDISLMPRGELVHLARDFLAFHPLWLIVLMGVAQAAVFILDAFLLLLTLLPSGPDNKYGPRPQNFKSSL